MTSRSPVGATPTRFIGKATSLEGYLYRPVTGELSFGTFHCDSPHVLKNGCS
jgi:hypothetical protein